MNESIVLSRRVMRLLQERLREDLWYSQERRDMFEEDCEEYGVYQESIDEDKKLIEELDRLLTKKKESPLVTKAIDNIFNKLGSI
jgi:hypothetical protein